MKAFGVRPKRDLGQNFLIDSNILDVIARAAELGPGDVVLEVGGGLGVLSEHLAERTGHVHVVEVDLIREGRARREGANSEVQELEAEHRPGDRLKPGAVLHHERISPAYRLDDGEQAGKDEVGDGGGGEAGDHDEAHAEEAGRAFTGESDAERREEPAWGDHAGDEQSQDAEAVHHVEDDQGAEDPVGDGQCAGSRAGHRFLPWYGRYRASINDKR